MNGETPLEEERGVMLALRLQARQAVAEAQEEGRLARQLDRDHVPKELGRLRRGPKQGNRPYSDSRRPNRGQPTVKELRVINCLSHGLTREEAAVVLGVSLETIRSQVKRARQVTACKTAPQLVAVCLRKGWLT